MFLNTYLRAIFFTSIFFNSAIFSIWESKDIPFLNNQAGIGSGTNISTPTGWVPVEELREGDPVIVRVPSKQGLEPQTTYEGCISKIEESNVDEIIEITVIGERLILPCETGIRKFEPYHEKIYLAPNQSVLARELNNIKPHCELKYHWVEATKITEQTLLDTALVDSREKENDYMWQTGPRFWPEAKPVVAIQIKKGLHKIYKISVSHGSAIHVSQAGIFVHANNFGDCPLSLRNLPNKLYKIIDNNANLRELKSLAPLFASWLIIIASGAIAIKLGY